VPDSLPETAKKSEGKNLCFVKMFRPSNLFETICAFLNRMGGDIFLGVADDGNRDTGQ